MIGTSKTAFAMLLIIFLEDKNMKKILTWGLCVVMLISVFSVCAFAADEEAPAGWAAFGDITITYDSELSSKITFDGQFNDWTEAGIKSNEIDALNMQAWTGTMPDDFSITTYFAADAEYLYIAFNITDSTKSIAPSSETEGTYGFDAFQIQLDFNEKFAAEEAFDRAVFYSFARREDGQMAVTVNESDANDGVYWAGQEYDGVVYVKGACTELANGWGAELALSWQMLYNQAFDKLEWNGFSTDGFELNLGPNTELKLGALVCYLDRQHVENDDGTTAEELVFAAGTIEEYGQMSDASTGFWPESAGIILKVISDEDVAISVETKEPTTEAPTEEPTTAPEGESDTSEDDDDETTEAPTTAGTSEETDAPEESGCKSVAGIGAIAIVSALGAAVVIKKRK